MMVTDRLNRITFELEKRGYNVRRHYYEYYIRYGGEFICVVSLFPAWNCVFILLRRKGKGHLNEVVSIIKGMFPEIIRIVLKEVG